MDLRKRLMQHGDVILIAVDKIPDGAKRVPIAKENFILERGEGVHTHVITDTDGLEVYEKDGVLYLLSEKGNTVTHEEHGPQTIQPLPQEKIIEREWDYESEEARNTED